MPAFADSHISTAGLGALIGTVVSAVSSSSVKVTVGGIELVARVVSGVSPALGAPVMLTMIGSNWFVTAILPAVPVSPPASPPEKPVTPPSDSSPPPKPVTRTGYLVCAPTSTCDFRDGKWRTDTGHGVDSGQVLQGIYPGYGNNFGCAFYGNKPHSLAGSTVTKCTLKMKRISAGVFAARRPTLWLLSQNKRPSGSATRNESTSGPNLAVNSSTTGFVLPNSWGQALVNGTRGGIGTYVSSGSPYMRFAGRGDWSSAFVVTIWWRRG